VRIEHRLPVGPELHGRLLHHAELLGHVLLDELELLQRGPVLHRIVLFVEELQQHAGFDRRGVLLVERLPVGPDVHERVLLVAELLVDGLHFAFELLHDRAELHLDVEHRHEVLLVVAGQLSLRMYRHGRLQLVVSVLQFG